MTYREHIFVCLNERVPDDPKGCCKSRGAEALLDQLKAATRGHKDIRINKAGCLGRCEEGPVIVRYPSGEWLVQANVDRCAALAQTILHQE